MMMAIAKLAPAGGHVGLGEVAQRCGISRKYLEQLVPPLRNAKLVRALPGRGGGYALARSPDQIQLSEIIEAAIGPIAITECAFEPETCAYAEFCNCQGLYALLNHRIAELLAEYSLADIMRDDWRRRVAQQLATKSRPRQGVV